jgi:hypothetical protein
MEVTYECPGMLPQKEARESHHALAMVPQTQLCGKMQELVKVMSILLSPLPSSKCRDAKKHCTGLRRCAKAQQKRLGNPEAMMTEALAMCDDRDAMMSFLRVGEECEQQGKVLGQAHSALTAVIPPKVCDESKAFMKRLGSNPFQLDSKDTMSASIPSVACTAAQQRCGASSRCAPVAEEMDSLSRRSAASNGQLLEVLKLCGNRTDFFAALDIAAECPGNSLQGQMQTLQRSLRNIPESSLCMRAMLEAKAMALESSPLSVPPVACVRAHSACRLDPECHRLMQKPGITRQVTNDMMQLCSSRHSFLLAMQIAVECPGPQLSDALRGAASNLANVMEDQLCAQAGSLLRISDEMSHHNATTALNQPYADAIDDEVTRIAQEESDNLVSAFDTAPRDGRLNGLEFQAMLADAKVEAKLSKAHKNAIQLLRPNDHSALHFNMKAIDFSKNGLIEPIELVAVLKPHLKVVLSVI